MRYFEILLTLHLLLSPLIELSLVTSLTPKKKHTSNRQHTPRRHVISRDQTLKKKSTTSTTSTKKVRFFLSCFKDGDGDAIKCSPVSHEIISDSEDKTKHGKKVAKSKTTSKVTSTNKTTSDSREDHSKTTSKITLTNKTSSFSSDEQSNVREKAAHYQRIRHGSNQTNQATNPVVQVYQNDVTGYKYSVKNVKNDNTTKNVARGGTSGNILSDDKNDLLSKNPIADRIHRAWKQLNRTDYDTVGALIKFLNNQDKDVFKPLGNETFAMQTISPTPSTKTNNVNSNMKSRYRQNSMANSPSSGQHHDVALDLNFIMQSVMSQRQSYIQKQVEAGVLDMTHDRENNVTMSYNDNGNHILPEIMLGNTLGKVSKVHKFHNKSDDEDIMAMTGEQGDVGDDFHNASANAKNIGNKEEMPSENPRLLMDEFMTSYMNRSTPLLRTTPQHVVSISKGNQTHGVSSGNSLKDKVKEKVFYDGAEQMPFNDSVLEQHLKQHFILETKDEQTSKYQKSTHNNNNNNKNSNNNGDNNDENSNSNNGNYHSGNIYNFRMGLEQVVSDTSSTQLAKSQNTHPTHQNMYGHQRYNPMTVKMPNPTNPNQYDHTHNRYATMRHIYEDPILYKPRHGGSNHRSVTPVRIISLVPTPPPSNAIASRLLGSGVLSQTATPGLIHQPSSGSLHLLSFNKTAPVPSFVGFRHSRSSPSPSLSSFRTNIDAGATSSTGKLNSPLRYEMYLSEMQKRFSELTAIQEERPTPSATVSPTLSFEPNTPTTTLSYRTHTPGPQRLSQYIDEMQHRFDEISVNKTSENQGENMSPMVHVRGTALQDGLQHEVQDGVQIKIHSSVQNNLESHVDITKSLLHQIQHTPTPAQRYDASMEEEINNQFEANLEYFPMEKIEDIFSDIEEARSMGKSTKPTDSKQTVRPGKTPVVRYASSVMSSPSIKPAEHRSSIVRTSSASTSNETSSTSFAASFGPSLATSMRASPSSHYEAIQTINVSSVVPSPSTKKAEVYDEFVSVYQELYGGVKDDFLEPDVEVITMEENSNQTTDEEGGGSMEMIPKNLTEADCDEVRSLFPSKDPVGKPVSGDEAFLLMKRNVDWEVGKFGDLGEKSGLTRRCHAKKSEKEQMKESVLKLHSSYEVSAFHSIPSSSKHINRPSTAIRKSLAISSSSSAPWWMLDPIAMMKELNQLAIYSVYSPPPPSALGSHFKPSSMHNQNSKHSLHQSSTKKIVKITSTISVMPVRASPAQVIIKTPATLVKDKASFTPAKGEAPLVPLKDAPVKVIHFDVQSVHDKSFSNTTSDNAKKTPNNRQAPSSLNNGKPLSPIDVAVSDLNNYYDRLMGIKPKEDKAVEPNTNNESGETSWNPLQDIESMDGKTGASSTNNEPNKTTSNHLLDTVPKNYDIVIPNRKNKPSKTTPNPSLGMSRKAVKIVVPNTPKVKEPSKSISNTIAALNVKVMSLNVPNPHSKSLTVPITEDSDDVLSLSKLMAGGSGTSGALSTMLNVAGANGGLRNGSDTHSGICGKNFLAQLKFPPNVHEFSKADIKKHLEHEIAKLYATLSTYLASNVVWVDDLKNAVGPEVGVDVELYFSERGCDHLQPLQQRVKMGQIGDFFVDDGTYSLLDDRIGAFNYWCQLPCADPYHCFPLCDKTCCGTQRVTSSTTNQEPTTGSDLVPLSSFPQHHQPVQQSPLFPTQQQLEQVQQQPQHLPPLQRQPQPPLQRQPQLPLPQPQLPEQQLQLQKQPQPPQQLAPSQPPFIGKIPYRGEDLSLMRLLGSYDSNSMIQPTVVYCNKLCRLLCYNSCNPVCCPDKEADLRQQFGARYTGLGRR